jgi:hypothetical protein
MDQLNELLHKRITRKQFPIAFALSLASMVELIRLAQRVSDGKLAPAKEPQSTRPNYGAWRPLTAGDAMTPTV